MTRSRAESKEAATVEWSGRRGRRLLFGEAALRRGWVTAEFLSVALTVQKHSELAGREVSRVGAILVHMGAMTPEQVSEVLEDLAGE
jgi:hypothetical protein